MLHPPLALLRGASQLHRVGTAAVRHHHALEEIRLQLAVDVAQGSVCGALVRDFTYFTFGNQFLGGSLFRNQRTFVTSPRS